MNEFDKNKKIEALLEETAEQVQPNLIFKAELEEKLRKAHKPRAALAFPRFNNLASFLTGVVVLGVLALFTLWIFQSLEPQNNFGNDDFSCPVTQPNGSVPPGENMQDPYFFGNGELWTTLWPEGKVVMQKDNIEPDGAYAMKWLIYRGVTGELSIEGRRLDADADPLRAFLSDGYGDNGVQIIALIFPTTGCWEVTAHVGESSLTFVTEVVFSGATPAPDINAFETVEPTNTEDATHPIGKTYNWRGMAITMNATFPNTPTTMNVYQAQKEIPATAEDARELAKQFKMIGSIYEVPGQLPDTVNYLIVDGNRQLRIRSDGYFSYVLDNVAWINNPRFVEQEDAEEVINDFMSSYGLGENHDIEFSSSNNSYLVRMPTPDGYPVELGYFAASGYNFRFNENGLLAVEAARIAYAPAIEGTIISAEEAFQIMLTNTDGAGVAEGMHFGFQPIGQSWFRQRPLDQTVSYYAWLNSTKPSIDGGAPLVTLDGYTVTASPEVAASIPSPLDNTFIEAIGQFHFTNGYLTFELASWKPMDKPEEGVVGAITREGDQAFVTITEGPKLILPEFPSDIPSPLNEVLITGITLGDTFEWKVINTVIGGGGGGGGGAGFFRINPSGTPVPFPPTQTVPIQEPAFDPQPFESLRGFVTVNRYEQSDGTERTEYTFYPDSSESGFPGMSLEGNGLETLENYNNMPIDIWGSITRIAENGLAVGRIEKFEIPYPDMEFQLLKGYARQAESHGKRYLLFVTEDAQTYALGYFDGSKPDNIGLPEDLLIYVEALIIPGETFEGYPAIRMFGNGEAINPVTGEDLGYTMSASEIFSVPDNPYAPNSTVSASIEKIELAYYIPDPRYISPDMLVEPQYVQPVWRFIGQYSDGTEFELFIQALNKDYLLPEFQDSIPPG